MLLDLKKRMNASDDDWMFPNRGKRGPIGHEQILGRRIQPVARKLGLPHITWRLLRHWGATQMIEKRVPIKAAQQRLGHSRPDLLLKRYAHVLDESAKIRRRNAQLAIGRETGKKGRKEARSFFKFGSQLAAKRQPVNEEMGDVSA